MHNKSYFSLLPLSFFISNAFAEDTQSVTLLDPIVVTGFPQTITIQVNFILKQTFQPLLPVDVPVLFQFLAIMAGIGKVGVSADR